MNKDQTFQNTARILKAVSYFSNMDDVALKQLSQSVFCREYETDQLILLEGEPCAGLYIVESGWLKAVKIGIDGREQVLQTLGPGEVFNAVSVFTGVPNQASVTALETSQVWMVRREVLLSMMDNHPGLARQVVTDLAGRVMYLVRMVEDLSLRSVEARLARLLLEQAQGEVVQRRRWATQSEMAARLGTVPDVVNRALRKLAEAGMIHFDRQQIRILDKEGLTVVAQMIE
jgi:CRP/FNR family transcriptional regulator